MNDLKLHGESKWIDPSFPSDQLHQLIDVLSERRKRDRQLCIIQVSVPLAGIVIVWALSLITL